MAIAKNTLLSATHTRKLEKCAEVTGYSVEALLAEAVSAFLECTAPVVMASARKDAKAAGKTRTPAKSTPAKPFIVSRTEGHPPVTLETVDALLRDWAAIQASRDEEESASSFDQSEVDKNISYLDEEFNA